MNLRSEPKATLARPPPTQQTARKGRLNFLYALSISESKMWSRGTSQVEADDLTAFGLGADPTTLRRNLDQVLGDLRGRVSDADLFDLTERLRRPPYDFDVFIHVLHYNRLNWANITQKISDLTGRAPVQIHSWSP